MRRSQIAVVAYGFNPRAYGRRDVVACRFHWQFRSFNPRAYGRRDAGFSASSRATQQFQSTRLREARQHHAPGVSCLLQFQSTRLREARQRIYNVLSANGKNGGLREPRAIERPTRNQTPKNESVVKEINGLRQCEPYSRNTITCGSQSNAADSRCAETPLHCMLDHI